MYSAIQVCLSGWYWWSCKHQYLWLSISQDKGPIHQLKYCLYKSINILSHPSPPFTVMVVSLSFHLVLSLYSHSSLGTSSRSVLTLLNSPTFWDLSPISQWPFSRQRIFKFLNFLIFHFLTMIEYWDSSLIVSPCRLPVFCLICPLVNTQVNNLDIIGGTSTVDTQVAQIRYF